MRKDFRGSLMLASLSLWVGNGSLQKVFQHGSHNPTYTLGRLI